MTTTTTTASRRRDRVAAALDAAATTTTPDDALAVLTAIARREARRIPSALAVTMTADDVAQETAARLHRTTDGALTIAALTSASAAARNAARRAAERAARSIVGTHVRGGTLAADVAADALTATTTTGPLAHRGTTRRYGAPLTRTLTARPLTLPTLAGGACAVVPPLFVPFVGAAPWRIVVGAAPTETGAVAAAVAAGGRDDVRLDTDAARRIVVGNAAARGRSATAAAGRRAGLEAGATLEKLADDGAAAAARHAGRRSRPGAYNVWAPVEEQTTASAVRIVRVQSLDAMLTAALRVPLPTTGRGAASAGRTLFGDAADRTTAAAFRTLFAATLADVAADGTGRGGAALADAHAALTGRTLDGWDGWRTLAHAARHDAASAARTAAAADRHAAALATASGASKGARRDANTAAHAAARHADDAATLAHVVGALAVISARRPVTLADAVWATLTATPDQTGRGASKGGAAKRRTLDGETVHLSTLRTPVLLTLLYGTSASATNGAAALTAALRHAADVALDGAPAAATPPPTMANAYRASNASDAARDAAALARRQRRDNAAAATTAHVVAALRSALTIWHPVTI